MLKIYLSGQLLSLLLMLLTELFYFGAGSLTSVKCGDVLEALGLSLLSWVAVAMVVFYYVMEGVSDFSNYGCGKFLEDFENELREMAENEKNGDFEDDTPDRA